MNRKTAIAYKTALLGMFPSFNSIKSRLQKKHFLVSIFCGVYCTKTVNKFLGIVTRDLRFSRVAKYTASVIESVSSGKNDPVTNIKAKNLIRVFLKTVWAKEYFLSYK